jgi:hypothetical protein
MHNTLRLLQPIPLLQLTALLQAIQLVDILQPLMAGRAMATAQDHPTSCAKLSERARLVTVAPTLSPMPNGKPLSSASGTAESASSAIAFRRTDYWLKPPGTTGLSFTLCVSGAPNQAASAALVSWSRCPLRRRCCDKSRPVGAIIVTVHRCRPDATTAVPIPTAAAPSNCLPEAVTVTPRRSCVRTGLDGHDGRTGQGRTRNDKA